MAPTLVQSAGGYDNATANFLTVSFSAATAGNLLVVIAGNQPTTAPTATGYTTAISGTNASGSAGAILYKVAAGGETSVTVNVGGGGSNRLGVEFMEWSGLTATPDKTATNSPAGSVTSSQTGSTGTLTSASEVAFACVGLDGFGSTSPSWNSSFTTVNHAATTVVVAGYLITAATTALNPTGSWSSGAHASGMIATFPSSTVTVSKTVTGVLNVGGAVNKTVTGVLNVGGRIEKTVTGKLNVQGPVPTGWTVRTEADWGGDPLTRPASMTALTSAGTTLSTKRGTQILQAGIETGTGTRKLDNSDRKLDPSNAASSLYPNVKPRTRMRDVINVGGTDHALHTGFAERFPIEWSQEVGYCTVTTQDQLGLTATATLPPSVLHQFTADLASTYSGAYWPMVETVLTGQADDVVGTRDGAYVGPVQQGQPATAYDSRSNAKFGKPGNDSGAGITTTAMQVTGMSVPDTFSFGMWFRWDVAGFDGLVAPAFAIFQQGSPVNTDPTGIQGTPSPNQVLAYLSPDSIQGRHHINIRIQDGTHVAVVKVPIATLVLDGKPHFFAFSITGTGRLVATWIDAATGGGGGGSGWQDVTTISNVVPLSTINVSSVISNLNTMGVGWGINWQTTTGSAPDSASIGHAFFLPNHFLTNTEIDQIAAAGFDAWDGDTTSERLTRVLDLVGIDTDDRNTFAGSQVCGPTVLNSQNAQSYIKKILATELSELYIDADGKWTFPERADYGPIIGSTDCSANPNYPAASKGDTYYVSVAGKIGGASGTSVAVGNLYFATADNAGGTQAAVGTSWDVLIPKAVFSDLPTVDGGAAYAPITPDYSYDRLVNDITVGRENGADQEVKDQTSIDTYGPIAGTKYRTGQAGAAASKLDTLHQTATAARDSAQWLIDRHKEPVVYIPQIVVSSIERTVSLDHMLLEVGDVVVVFARPPDGVTVDPTLRTPIGIFTTIEQVANDFPSSLEWQRTYSLTDGWPYP